MLPRATPSKHRDPQGGAYGPDVGASENMVVKRQPVTSAPCPMNGRTPLTLRGEPAIGCAQTRYSVDVSTRCRK